MCVEKVLTQNLKHVTFHISHHQLPFRHPQPPTSDHRSFIPPSSVPLTPRLKRPVPHPTYVTRPRWQHVVHSPTATCRTPTSTQPCHACLPELWLPPIPLRHLLPSLLATLSRHTLMTRRLQRLRKKTLVLILVSLL